MCAEASVSKYYPKEIGNILYDSSKNLIGFHVIIDGSLVTHGQVHAKLIEKISEHAGTIRFIKIYSYLHTNDIALVFFLDTSGTNTDPKKFLATLKAVPYFKSAQLIKPIKEGLIFDTYSFPPLYAGEKSHNIPQIRVRGDHKRIKAKIRASVQRHPVPHRLPSWLPQLHSTR